MGEEKSLLHLAGRTMIETVADRVSSVANDVFVVANDGAVYEEFGFRVVPDAIPGAGSLGGVYTALLSAAHDLCLVVACDMPLLNIDLLRRMAESIGQHDVVIPSLSAERSDQGKTETLETMHAIYRTSIAPDLERRIRAGDLKVATALTGFNMLRITEEAIRRIDPDLESFFNVNTPDDYAFARSRLERRR